VNNRSGTVEARGTGEVDVILSIEDVVLIGGSWASVEEILVGEVEELEQNDTFSNRDFQVASLDQQTY
jgi:hypothetical protein